MSDLTDEHAAPAVVRSRARRRRAEDRARPATPTGRSGSSKRFVLLLLLVTVAAAGIRVTYVLAAKRHEPLQGDQIYYSGLADGLARGDGFRDPFIRSRTVPSADHPPLTSLVLTPAAWLWRDDPGSTGNADHRILAERLTMALAGAATVFAIGMAARRLVVDLDTYPDDRTARRVGLWAAALAAVYPGLWINDGLLMSESIGALTIALVVLAAVRALDRPSSRRLFWLGAAVGLATLARAESLMLAPLLVVPVALTRRGPRLERPPRAALRWLAAGTVGVALVIAPWVVPNLVRFDRPTTLSTNDGLTLLGTNCDPAWNGNSRGFWIFACIAAVDSDHDGVNDWDEYRAGTLRPPANGDWSTVSADYRSAALHYLRHHLGGLPRVVLAREARLWGLSPTEMVSLNEGEGREPWASWAAAWSFDAVVVLGLLGWLVLWRRERPVWPLAVHAVSAVLTGAAFYGLWRFRIGAEVGLLLGAAVAIDAVISRLRRRGKGGSPDGGHPTERGTAERMAV